MKGHEIKRDQKIFDELKTLRTRLAKLEEINTEHDKNELKNKEIKRAIEQLPEGIATSSNEGILLFVNQAWAKMHGYEVDELTGKPVAILDSLADRKKIPKIREEIQKKGIWQGELVRVRKDGSYFPAMMTSAAVKDEAEKQVCIISIIVDINKRKYVEGALLESEKQYRVLFESCPNPMWVYDLETLKFLAVNDAAIQQYGYSREEFQKMTVMDLQIPDDIPELLNNISRVTGTGNLSGTWRHLKKDGTIFLAEIVSYSLTFAGRNSEVVMAQDVTQRCREKEALLHRVELESLITEISTNFISVSPEEIDKEINHTLALIGESTGVDRCYLFQLYEKGSLMKNTHEWCASDIKPQVGKLSIIQDNEELPWFTKKLKLMETFHVPSISDLPQEALAEKKFFGLHDIKSHLTFPLVSGKSLAGFLGLDSVRSEKIWSEEEIRSLKIVGDILVKALEKNRLIETLQKSEKQYRNIVDTAQEGVWVLDAEAKTSYVNRSMAEMLGYSRDEMLGRSFFDFIYNSSRIESKQYFDRHENASKKHRDFLFRKKNGSDLWAILSTNPMFDDNGQFYGMLAMVIDITQRKQAEEDIKRYTAELEESNCIKELFTDIMSHDILNPLNIANGYIALLLENETDRKKIETLEKAWKNLAKSLELIDKATLFSKLESLENIEFEDLDLKEVIEKVTENLTPLADNANMKIYQDISCSMPVKANPIIEQVISNFITNAMKYAPEGKKLIVSGSSSDHSWRISVTDFGEGLNDEDKKGIFERFQRKEKKGVKGSGLGLTIAKKIVELHGGRIWVEDNPEGGAVFIAEIPKS